MVVRPFEIQALRLPSRRLGRSKRRFRGGVGIYPHPRPNQSAFISVCRPLVMCCFAPVCESRLNRLVFFGSDRRVRRSRFPAMERNLSADMFEPSAQQYGKQRHASEQSS